MQGFTHNTGELISADGTRLFYQSWEKPDPRGIIVLSHGVGEHSSRYDNLLQAVNADDIEVYALDHRGHGRSEGKRGHIMSFDQYLDDFNLLVKLAQTHNPGRPTIILGHSMGGVIALKYVLKYGQDFAGLILSSAGFKNKVEVPAWKAKAALLLSGIWPSLSMPTGIESRLLSHDQIVVQAYIDDPLVHDLVSSRWYTEFTAAGEECLAGAGELKLPLLIIHGQSDGIVDYQGSTTVMQKAASNDKELHLIEDLYHETMNETEQERNKVLKIISTWIVNHTSHPHEANEK
jgi:acylglycerol lipase